MRFPALSVLSSLLLACTAQAQQVPESLYQPAEHVLPLRYAGQHPTIELQLQGAQRSLTFVVDTAAGASIIDLGLARQLGLLAEGEDSQLTVHDASGNANGTPLTRPVPFQAGTLSWNGVMLAADLTRLAGSATHPIDGIFGADMLAWFDVEFDLAHGRLVLRKDGGRLSGDCMANALPGRDGPLADFGFAPVHLKNEQAEVDAIALVDTGAAYSILNMAAARALGLKTGDPRLHPAGQTQGMSGQAVSAWFYDVPAMTLGQLTSAPQRVVVSAMPVFAQPGQDEPPAMILGADLLKQVKLRVTPHAESICLSPAA